MTRFLLIFVGILSVTAGTAYAWTIKVSPGSACTEPTNTSSFKINGASFSNWSSSTSLPIECPLPHEGGGLPPQEIVITVSDLHTTLSTACTLVARSGNVTAYSTQTTPSGVTLSYDFMWLFGAVPDAGSSGGHPTYSATCTLPPVFNGWASSVTRLIVADDAQ